MLEVVRKLVLKFLAPDTIATSTVSERVSGLDHELGDDAVEDDTLEVAALRMTDEVLDCLRSLLREEPDVNVAERSVDGRGRSQGCSKRLHVSGCRCNCLLVACRALIEDIAIPRFISVEGVSLHSPTCMLERTAYSGSLRVNM